MQFSSIWPIDRTLSGATTPVQSWPGSDGNEGVLCIPQSSNFTGTSPSACLVSYLGHSLLVVVGGSYPSAEKQLVYSTAPADWAMYIYNRKSIDPANNDNNDNNCKSMLCDRDETVNLIINECCKLVQKEYNMRHDWVGKVSHWESWNRLKFDYSDKLYMYKPESILENEVYKIIWDFEIKSDFLILARRPDFVLINKKKKMNLSSRGFCWT